MKCYASALGNCSGKITREHFVSRSALEIAGESELQVTGFQWQQNGGSMKIGIDSLVSKVLCAHHNTELSPLDESGRALLRAIKTIFTEGSNEDFRAEVFHLDGNRIELWLLKIMCGLLASQNKAVPQAWIEVLFGETQLSDGSGLHLFGEEGREATWFFNLVRVHSVNDQNGKMAGAKFGIGGLAFLLALGKPRFTELTMRSYHRPDKIVFTKAGIEKVLEFSWQQKGAGGNVGFQIGEMIEDGDSIPRPIVRKYRP